MKRKVKYTPISFGQIITAWQILYISSKYETLTPKTASGIALRSGKLGGTVPVKDAIRICLDYELISIKSGVISLEEIAVKKIVPICDNEEPNEAVLRGLLAHVISYHDFEWLILYDPDPIVFRSYLLGHDQEWTYLLDNAQLFNFSDEEVIEWWSHVLVKYEDNKQKLKKAVGDVGEKLTYQFEIKRIGDDGYVPSKSFVKWASNMSDRFGFDIQSIRGKYFKNKFEEKDKIRLEVKSSDNPSIERFRFFISKPEWIKAMEDIDCYYFFCWPGVNVNDETAQNGPYVIPAKFLIDEVPKDKGGISEWSECRVVMDVNAFRVI